MFDQKKVDDAVKQLLDAIPPGILQMKEELEKNFRAVLQSMFSKMDLVTREEFDVQTKVLQRTRQKMEALEEKVKQLEEAKRHQ